MWVEPCMVTGSITAISSYDLLLRYSQILVVTVQNICLLSSLLTSWECMQQNYVHAFQLNGKLDIYTVKDYNTKS